MRPFTSTLPLAAALAHLDADARPIERTERLPLDDAHGRVLATPIVALSDVPPFDRAVMDGYAVIAADTASAAAGGPVALREVGRVYAGDVAGTIVTPGACLEIATGAPMPAGADAVVMVEQTSAAGPRIEVHAPVSPRQNVAPRGSDIRAGSTVLDVGALLTPARLGAVAALGLASVCVFERPRVAIVSTGNELVDPGAPLAAGQIHDINRSTLAGIVRAHGGDPVLLPSARDTVEELRTAFDRAAAADLVVFSGGSSVGERDLLVDVVRERGEVVFHGIAVKPGKPTLFARCGGALVLGMPGNPTSCLSNAYILLVPLLRRLARLPRWQPERRAARLSAAVSSTVDRHQFYPVRLDGELAVPAFKGSGEITSLSQADGYFEIPIGVAGLAEGTEIDVTLF